MLHALRNVQHRMLNAAMRAWWESDGKERATATAAVLGVLEAERAYWTGQVPKIETGIENLRAKGGKVEMRGGTALPGQVGEDMTALQRQLRRAQVCAALRPPSSIYDACVYFTSSKYREYKKHAFRGDKSMATFREGQPVRVRDGAWTLAATEKGGVYDLAVPVQSDGRRVERALLKVIPDGGAMHGWAKKLVAGEARPCDARLVYAEGKKKWYAKLTLAVPVVGMGGGDVARERGVAALRRGVRSAFVVVAEDGDVHMIDGNDVIVHKARANARRREIGRHLRSGELGQGARGHGKKRRFAALTRIDDAEKKFVDAKVKQWAAKIASWLDSKNVGRVIVADGSVSEFYDRVVGEPVAPFLHRWPLAAMNDRVTLTCRNHGIEVELKATKLDARHCPSCGHENQARPTGFTYECAVCGLKRPADQIVAWNMLREAVGPGPVKKREAKREEFAMRMRSERTRAVAS